MPPMQVEVAGLGTFWNLIGKSSVNSAIELFPDFRRELTSKVPAVKREIPASMIADVCFVTYKLHRRRYTSTKTQRITSEQMRKENELNF